MAIDGREAMDDRLIIDKEEQIIGFIYLFIMLYYSPSALNKTKSKRMEAVARKCSLGLAWDVADSRKGCSYSLDWTTGL